MAEKKNNKGLGLQETKGSFQIRGKLTGCDKDKFYTELTTSTGKPMRMVNVGVEIDKNKSVYISLNGMERDVVYFSKTEGKGKDRKTTTEKVKWADRFTFNKKDFRPIGINLGLTKVTDSTGKEVNDKKILIEYDACKYIADNAKDGMSVFVRGKNEFSTYQDRHQTRFVPSQMSLCKDVDFDSEEFNVIGNFEQVIVFMGIETNDEGNSTVSAKIVTYNSIEDAEFIIDKSKSKFASTLRKLKPYTALKVFGDIMIEHDIEEIEEDDDDGWGESNPMDRVNNPTKRILLITGADKDSVDTEIYSEEIIDKAIAKTKATENANKDFGSDDSDWGSVSDSELTDEDDEW